MKVIVINHTMIDINYIDFDLYIDITSKGRARLNYIEIKHGNETLIISAGRTFPQPGGGHVVKHTKIMLECQSYHPIRSVISFPVYVLLWNIFNAMIEQTTKEDDREEKPCAVYML